MAEEYTYGRFNEAGDEFIVTDPQTPRAFDNFLWNDTVFSNVQQTGVGTFDYQVGENEAVQLLTGVGRICDIDVFGREHLMSRLIYVRDNDTGEFWNVNWEPVKAPYECYTCAHGLGYSVIKTRVKGICAELFVFVPPGKDAVELWSLKLQNASASQRCLSIFVYNQFQFRFKWGFDSYGDIFYRSTRFDREDNAVVARKYPYTRPHDYLTGFMTADEPITAFDGTRDAFVGLYNTLQAPAAVVNGSCTGAEGSADATIGAMQFDCALDAGAEKKISMILGATDSEEKIRGVKEKYLGHFDAYFQELRAEKRKLAAIHSVRTPDAHFNRLLNGWAKQQALFGAAWCRWGWTGYRDIVQHGMGVSGFAPEKTRKILVEALRHQYQNGLALRGWNPADEKAYSDSALWLVFTLTAYIKETGDAAFLEEIVPYYDGGADSVYAHIDRTLDFLENNKGGHGLNLIKFGDWNDSLTAVGKEGRGESVWLSETYAYALERMAALAGYLGREAKKSDYARRREAMLRAVNESAWDGEWYLRCFDDDGNPIGSHKNQEGRIFIESQGWALISGAAEKDRAEALIRSCDRILNTPVGYRLLFPSFTKIDDHVGRLSSMQPGICENGTVYSHTNIWMVLGLLKARRPDKAYELFRRITPGYISDENDPKLNCPPYVYANCYYGPDHKNNPYQMEYTWVTGSIAWVNHVLINDLLGIEADYNGLRLHPCIPLEWDGFEMDRPYRGSVYHIRVRNPGHARGGEPEIWLDGEKLAGRLIPWDAESREHQVDVILGNG